MKILNLGSGSKGNSTVVWNEQTTFLIDAGLSFSEIEKRLGMANIKPSDISAIFVTHEHIDHVKAIDAFSQKYNTKIYAHADCWPYLLMKSKKIKLENRIGFYDMPFEFSGLKIEPIRLSHDSSCCYGFSITEKDKKFTILTDLGHTNDRIIELAKTSSLLLIEANHDEDMLKACEKYPKSLKSRILSNHGHLSNAACALAIAEILKTGTTKNFALGHLSEETNTPILAKTTVCEILKNFGFKQGEDFAIMVMSQTHPSSIFNLK